MVNRFTASADETVKLGEELGKQLGPGSFIAVYGDLGAGKTQFARGVAAGLGVDRTQPITSPTYTLVNEYQGRLPFYHFDLYRLHDHYDVVELGFEEYFYGQGVCLVEWAERITDTLPALRLDITISRSGENARRFEFQPFGSLYESILKKCFDHHGDS
ncbi:tRNA (adenosine(37)-N6)-threonylcarbamoyltransferase complex ATPase subunit type 1 TsaE [Geotalea uraniireducens]|uniref:tRNA threonylcarbamoyladenosine biosynthesis protein TsaE n=1 Tax=Geotalea uraniireducens TaxID=351604 RepID=A0ABM8ELE6_9BACT|nr:tRNA (adenosine(37)-N6)-threonylcarbamoyltransferase complex ATPase subunit type 1 TsaE [Geotalea uraniireducens]